jgi:hypothetical protein
MWPSTTSCRPFSPLAQRIVLPHQHLTKAPSSLWRTSLLRFQFKQTNTWHLRQYAREPCRIMRAHSMLQRRRADRTALRVIAFTVAVFMMGCSTAAPAENFPLHTSAAVHSFGPIRSSSHGPIRSSSQRSIEAALSSTFPSWTTSQLSQSRALPVAVSLPSQGLLLVAGGWNIQSQATYANVDIYHAQTNQWSTALLSAARVKFAAASLPKHGVAMFAGGFNGPPSSPNMLSSVDVYNALQASWSTAALSVARGDLAAASLPLGLAFFAGGSDKTQGTELARASTHTRMK